MLHPKGVFPGIDLVSFLMKASDIIDELKTFYKDGVEYRSLDRHLSDADVERWTGACGWSRSQLFDEIAISA